jgi:Icc protein
LYLVHLTDPHLVAPGRRLYGLDPLVELDKALDHLTRRHAAADLLLITGDLTDLGEAEAYAALGERLRRLPMPNVLLLGNHDDRGVFRSAFPEAPLDAAGFVQRAVDHPSGVSLVALDTHVPGAAHGQLCEARLAWLDAALAERKGRFVLLAMHHPPIGCGIPGMDAIGLGDAGAFWALVERHGNVGHVLAGHIHRPFLGRRGGVSISALPGTSHQVALQFATAEVVLGSHEPGAYAVIRASALGLDLHHEHFADKSPRFVFGDAANRAQRPADLPPVPPPHDRLL